MPFNGSGVFSLIAGNPVVTGTTISSTWANNTLNDLSTGLTTAITKDGQTTPTANIPMGGYKITGLGAATANGNAVRYEQVGALAASQITGFQSVQQFRLTLTTGVPVTTADVTGATTIYACPYDGSSIALYDGSTWNVRTSAEFSLAVGTLTSGLPYDVFCYDNATVPTLEFLAWTNTTTRATALVYQDGILCKTGALTRRYLGTFYTTATTTTEDSATNRYLFNYYHRKPRYMERKESTASWTYTIATWRQANGAAANQVNFFVGVVEDRVSAEASVGFTTSASQRAAIGVGLNSVTAPAGLFSSSIASGAEAQLSGKFKGMPALGLNYLAWLEWGQASGTTTWYGVVDAANQQVQSGIVAEVMA